MPIAPAREKNRCTNCSRKTFPILLLPLPPIGESRRDEIQAALKELAARYEGAEPDTPADLCWLYGSYMDDYLHDVDVCQRFATRNRVRMLVEILARTGLDVSSEFHTAHNYIDVDEMVLRKGPIAESVDIIDVMKPIYNFKAS